MSKALEPRPLSPAQGLQGNSVSKWRGVNSFKSSFPLSRAGGAIRARSNVRLPLRSWQKRSTRQISRRHSHELPLYFLFRTSRLVINYCSFFSRNKLYLRSHIINIINQLFYSYCLLLRRHPIFAPGESESEKQATTDG